MFCFAKPEVCNEKAITEGDFAWLFHRYWNAHISNEMQYACKVFSEGILLDKAG
ncbi:MAG: hypothetical protein ACI4EI_11525 [Muricoprocola sp.]